MTDVILVLLGMIALFGVFAMLQTFDPDED